MAPLDLRAGASNDYAQARCDSPIIGAFRVLCSLLSPFPRNLNRTKLRGTDEDTKLRVVAAPMFLCAPPLLTGWVASSSSIFGAQRGQIADQLAGVPLPADRNWQSQLGSLWTFPADPLDTTGLGGGITYAFNPELCGKLMPQFREDIAGATFITCDDIRASVFRAFNSWGANSRFFKFTDVTGECEKMGLLHDGQTKQPHGGCAIAEIWITALTRDESRRRELQEARRRLGDAQAGELEVESAEQNLDSGGALFVASAFSWIA